MLWKHPHPTAHLKNTQMEHINCKTHMWGAPASLTMWSAFVACSGSRWKQEAKVCELPLLVCLGQKDDDSDCTPAYSVHKCTLVYTSVHKCTLVYTYPCTSWKGGKIAFWRKLRSTGFGGVDLQRFSATLLSSLTPKSHQSAHATPAPNAAWSNVRCRLLTLEKATRSSIFP